MLVAAAPRRRSGRRVSPGGSRVWGPGSTAREDSSRATRQRHGQVPAARELPLDHATGGLFRTTAQHQPEPTKSRSMGPRGPHRPGSAETWLRAIGYEPSWSRTVAQGVPTASGRPDPFRREASTSGCRAGTVPKMGVLEVSDGNECRGEHLVRGSSRPERVISMWNAPTTSMGRYAGNSSASPREARHAIDEETGDSVRRGIELLARVVRGTRLRQSTYGAAPIEATVSDPRLDD